jgi:hypothetical protein
MKTYQKVIIVLILALLNSKFICPQWVMTNGPSGVGVASLSISKLAVNENYLFVDRLLSTDNGITWKMSGLPGFNSIAFSSSYIFAGTDNGVYLSSDKGTNWKQINNGLTNTLVHSLTIIKSNILAGTYGGVFLSSNNGNDWAQAGLDTMGLYSLTSDGNNIYAGTKYGVFFSLNNGISWTQKNNGIPDTSVFSLAVAGNIIFALAGDTVYCSTNDGNNWTQTSPNALPVNSLIADGINIYAVMSHAVQVSSDKGLTWNSVFSIGSETDVQAFAVHGFNYYIDWVDRTSRNTYTTFQISTDNGVNWTNIVLPNSYVTAIFANETNIIASKTNDILYGMAINTEWITLHSYLEAMHIRFLAGSGNNIYMGAVQNRSPGGLFRSTDNGTNWTGMSIGAGYPMDVYALAVSGSKIFVGASRMNGVNTGIYLSTDNGLSWALAGLDNISVKCIAASGNNVFAGTGNGVYRSSDDGANWIQINSGLTDTAVKAITISGANIIIAANSGMFLSTDNGSNWKSANNGLTNTLINCISNCGNNIFVGTDSGVFLSLDNGSSWSQVGLSGLPVYALSVNESDIYAGTGGAGVCKRPLIELGLPVELTSFTANISKGIIHLIWITATELNNSGFNIERSVNKTDWTIISFVQGQGTNTSAFNYSYLDKSITQPGKYYYRLKQIDHDGTFKYSNIVEVELTAPLVFALNQNYPNPFNPNTVISYSLPVASIVKLIIYNTLGQTIKNLESEYKPAGIYSVNFNASDLPSGAYFYKLEAGQFSQINKMILIK